MIGETIAHYRIVAKLGEGGMGEVYKAEDTRLDRLVALKVLPPELADAEHLERFEREAKTVAGLNHPNIVTLHSVEEAEGVRFLTMELVEGETLGRHIPEGGLPLERFFDLAVPVADALHAAHERGIVHRDLKPGNIMIDRDGRVKVLDFGLAKLRAGAAAPSRPEAPTEALTGEGRVLGTVQYMSPEQVQGKPLDQRSDIFSLGVVLYEMASGRRPFQGETSADVVSAVLRDAPPRLTEIADRYPRHLGRILKRCLEKDPSRRYQSALEVRNELENLRQEIASGEVEPASGPVAVAPEPPRRAWWPWAAAAALVAVVALFLLLRPGSEITSTATRLTATFTELTQQAGLEVEPSLSPDGKFVVYASDAAGNWDIYLQRIGGRKPINLTQSSAEDDFQPAFSPDGELIAFRSERGGGGLFVMGATGESVRRLTDFGYSPAWAPGGDRIVFCTEKNRQGPGGRATVSELWTVAVDSGETRRLSEGDAIQPRWSPHGQRIAYWGLPPSGGQRDLWTVAADGSDPVPVTDDPHLDWSPAWSPDGRYLYFSSDRGGSLNLWRVAIDETSGKVLKAPEPLTTPARWSGEPSVAAAGRQLVFTTLAGEDSFEKVAFDPESESLVGPPERVSRTSLTIQGHDLSPDGRWLAFASAGRQEDLFVLRTDGSELRQLTDDREKDRGPAWSPDGELLISYSDRGGRYELWTIRPDGSGLERLTETTGRSFWYPRWAPDGTRIAVQNESGTWLFDATQPRPLRSADALPPLGEDRSFRGWSWSPDGKHLAGYVGSAVGPQLPGLMVFSFATEEYSELAALSGGGRNAFGVLPVWLSDGRRLVTSAEEGLLVVDSRSKRVKQLLDGQGDALQLVGITPDEKTLYYLRRTDKADIWLATLE